MNHKHILQFEILNKFNKSCINLQKLHPDDSSYRCTVCQQDVPETALLYHKCITINDTVCKSEGMLIKYSIRISDYLLKCAVCFESFSIRRTPKRLNQL